MICPICGNIVADKENMCMVCGYESQVKRDLLVQNTITCDEIEHIQDSREDSTQDSVSQNNSMDEIAVDFAPQNIAEKEKDVFVKLELKNGLSQTKRLQINEKKSDKTETPSKRKKIAMIFGVALIVIIAILLAVFVLIPMVKGNNITDNKPDENELEYGSIKSSDETNNIRDNDENKESEKELLSVKKEEVDNVIEITNTVTWNDLTELGGNIPEFYGVWCAATKNKLEAVNIAQSMVNQGISGQVFYSENWSNLASGGWYIVSAGSYENEAQANSALSYVKQYYPSAFIQYSGIFIEHPDSIYNDNEDEVVGNDEMNNDIVLPTPEETDDGHSDISSDVSVDGDTSESAADEYINVEYLIYLALTQEITEEDLEGYTSFELSAARNGIFAFHGNIFKNDNWNNFYSIFDWYIPDPDFSTDDLNTLENHNASVIRKYEEEKFGQTYSF